MITKLKLIEIMNNEVRRKKNIQSLKKNQEICIFHHIKIITIFKNWLWWKIKTKSFMYIHPFYVIVSANMRRFGIIHPKFEHLRSQI